MNRYFRMIIAAALIGVSTSANAIDRNALAQYASSLKGLKKEQLKQKLHELMNEKTVLKYGSGKEKPGTASGTPIVIIRPMRASTATASTNSRSRKPTRAGLSRA